MGILRKLGNFAGDAASFAVPAGTFLAGTALGGGNPMGGMALLGAAGAGAGGFAANEEEERVREYQRRMAEAQQFANLRNAINPRANAQPVVGPAPKSGIMETVARATGQGIGALQTAQQIAEAKKMRDLQMREAEARLADLPKQQELRDMQMGAARSTAQRQFGSDVAGQGGQVDVRVDSPYNTSRQPAVRTQRMNLGATAPPADVSAGFAEGQSAMAAARMKAATEAEELDFKRRGVAVNEASERRQMQQMQETAAASMRSLQEQQARRDSLLSMVASNPQAFDNLPTEDKADVLLQLHTRGQGDLAKQLSGKPLLQGDAEGIRSAGETIALLDEMQSLLTDLGGFEVSESGEVTQKSGWSNLGPIGGRSFAAGSPESQKMARLQQLTNQVTPVLYRMNQTGVMTDPDFERTKDLLPDPTTMGSEVNELRKLLDLRRTTEQSYQRWRSGLAESGYRLPPDQIGAAQTQTAAPPNGGSDGYGYDQIGAEARAAAAVKFAAAAQSGGGTPSGEGGGLVASAQAMTAPMAQALAPAIRQTAGVFGRIGQAVGQPEGFELPPVGLGELPGVPLAAMNGKDRKRIADILRDRLGFDDAELQRMTLPRLQQLGIR